MSAGAAVAAACASAPPGGPGIEAGIGTSGSLERRVYGIEVRDDAGNPVEHPFLGGFNVPRPQWVDIDQDGDQDLFIQEASGELIFFERIRELSEHRYAWRTDRFQHLDVGEWYRFADIDGDGDHDLLAEERFSYLRYYRNDGTNGVSAFTLVADSLRDRDGRPLFSDRQNIPNVADIDCDGRLDLFIGRLVGTVTRYEAIEEAGLAEVPRFRLVTDRFENIEIVADFGSLHGANTLALTDIDADGDQDFFWGDFFEAGLLLIENRGSCGSPSLSGEPEPFPTEAPIRTSGYNAPTFADADGDGDEDLLVGVLGGAFNPNLTSVANLHYLEQTESGLFEARSSRYLSQVDVGSESIPAFADLDGDGDQDLYLSNKIDPADLSTSRIYRFLNVGSPEAPSFRLAGPLELTGDYHYAPSFADLDADGDLDMVLGSWRKVVAFYRNDGTATEPDFVLADSAMVTLTRGSNTTPALVDIDADGDLDLFVGEASGTLNYYLNEGTPDAPSFRLVSDEFGGIDAGRRSFPVFLDLEGDGDQDLLLGHELGDLIAFRNVGSAQEALFERDDSVVFPAFSYSAPAFSDIDGDGDLDYFVGAIGGGLLYYENVAR